MRGLLPKIGAAFAVVIGVVSALFTITGKSASLGVALAIIAGCLFLVTGYFLVKDFERSRLKLVSLEDGIKMHCPRRGTLRALFSAGDQLRQLVESGFFSHSPLMLEPGSSIDLIVRSRASDGEQVVIDGRLERMRLLFAKIGVDLKVKSVKWDNFMIGGLVLGDDVALVKFYVRDSQGTRALHERYIVARRDVGLEGHLYDALTNAFDVMWQS